MALYLFRFAYTAEAWEAQMHNPQDRRDMIGSRVFALGGSLQGFWYSFGESDGYALAELPDNVAAASLSVAVMATGSFRYLDTTVLVSVEEMIEAMQRADTIAYAKPGG